MHIHRLKQLPLALLCLGLSAGGALLTQPAYSLEHSVAAQTLQPQQVLATMEQVARWQLAHPSGYPLDDWTEGVGDAGMMALAGWSADPQYREAMRLAGEKLRWRLGPSKFHADDHVVGQMYAELYQHLRDPRMLAPMRAQFDEMLAEPRPGSLNWMVPDVLHRWSWCDSLFMGPPAWARLSAVTGDSRYLDFALRNWWLSSDYLYDRQEHLYFRDSRYFTLKEANGQKVFWGRGNGWVMAGLVRMLQYIPSQHPERARFVEQYREMAQRLITLQQADGFWRASLLDPASYPHAESSGTGLYTYALAWGVNQGILPREQYAAAVKRGWQALTGSVLADGKLIHVQPIGADPKQFDAQSSDVFAVGAFLLAGSEMLRMGLTETRALAEFTVQNEAATARLDLPVVLQRPEKDLVVLDSLSNRLLTTQQFARGLYFRTDLAAGETRRFLLVPRSALRLPLQGGAAALPGQSPAIRVQQGGQVK